MKIKPMLGEFELDGIEYIESSEQRDLVEHRVPGLAGNYFQDMGTVPNTIVIVGSKHGDEARDTFLEGIRELFNAGEPTTFVADINTATDLTEVVIEDLQVAELAGTPDSFRYLIRVRKYTEPPEPPSAGLLDAGILDDALAALGVMDLLDALVDIPNVADPTTPLKGAMDGVKSALGGLNGATDGLSRLLRGDGAGSSAAGPAGSGAPAGSTAAGTGAAPGAASGAGAPSGPGVPAGPGGGAPGGTTPPAPLPIDPTDPSIDAATGAALQGLLDAPEAPAAVAALVAGVQGGALAGLFGAEAPAARQLAAAHGVAPSSLIPQGQDAVLVLDAAAPLTAPPTIVIRSEARDDAARLGAALEAVGQTFALFQQGALGPCAGSPSAIPVANLVPSTFCQVPVGTPGGVKIERITRGLVGMFFETDKTFLLPSAMRSIRTLNQFYRNNPSGELLVVGHTDTVGPQLYNLELSKRRAENVAAYLTDAVEVWTAYYQPQPISKQWGTREDQHMLSALPEGGVPFYTGIVNGIAGPSTTRAVTQFQEFSNANRGTTLTVDGIAGPNTRRELVKAYMELDGTSLPHGTPIFSQGCGEFHPEVPTGDEVEEARNRRVEVFFFPDQIDPPMPVGGCQAPGCVEYPEWRSRAERTIDFTKKPGSLAVSVSNESTGQPIAEADVTLTGIESRAAQTDDFGHAFFEQLIAGDYTLSIGKDAFKTKTMPVTVGPGKASAEKSPAPDNQQHLFKAGDGEDSPGGTSQVVVSLQPLREFIVNVKEHPAGAPPPATGAATAFSHGDPGHGLTDLAKEVKRAQARPLTAVSSLVLVRFADVMVGQSVRDTPLTFKEAGTSGRASVSRAEAAPQAGKDPKDLTPSVVRWRILEGTPASNREQLEIFPGTTDLTIATRCRLSLWADTNFVTAANLDNAPGASGSIDDLSLLRTIMSNKSGDLDFVRDRSEAASNAAIRLCHDRGIQVHAGWGSTPQPTKPTPANPNPPKNDGEQRADHFNRWMTDLAKAHVMKEDGRFVMGNGAKPEIDRVAGRIMELCKLTDEGPDSFDGFGFDVEGMKNEPFEPGLDKDQRHLLLRRMRVIFTELCRELARRLADHGKVLTVACAGIVNHTVDADGQPDFYEGLLNESFSLPVQQIWSYHAALGHPNFIIRPMAYDRHFSTQAGLRKWHHDIVKYAIGKVGLHPGQFQLGLKPGEFDPDPEKNLGDRVNSTEIRERCKHLFRPNRVGFIQFALGKPVALGPPGNTGNNWSFWNNYNTYLNGLDFTVTDRELIAPPRTLGQPLQGPLDEKAVARLKPSQSQTLVKKP